jgi:hypothetical protein
VRSDEADVIAKYLASSVERARETFDAAAMMEGSVYKTPTDAAREETIELLLAYERIYRAAAEEGEYVLVSFD